MSDIDVEQTFVDIFIRVAEDVEKSHDFEQEIKSKKESEKLKLIMEIQERLSLYTRADDIVLPVL